jgi:hypothetical protein
MWDPQWDGLSASRDGIRLDLRGFGASTSKPLHGAVPWLTSSTPSTSSPAPAATPQVYRVDWADIAHLPSMEKPHRFLELLLYWTDARE